MQKDVRSLAKSEVRGKQTEEQFFTDYKKLFFSAVKWNTFESLSYQIIFVLHQIGLFLYCDRTIYGEMGALFASSYIAVTFLVGGFDGGLLPFFKECVKSKHAFKTFLLHFFVRHCVFMAIIAPSASFVISYFFPTFFVSKTLIVLVTVFIMCEAIKKILKQILYLSFLNRQAAVFEVFNLCAYVFLVWTWHLMGYDFSLELFLCPFIGLSLLFSFFCVRQLYWYYKTLPSETPFSLPSFSYFFSTRSFVLVNQMCRLFFSSNFLIPLFAIQGGFKEAGVLTFANYLTHACTFFVQKITLPPAEALFSRMRQFSIVIQYRALLLTLSLFAFLTVGLGIIFLFNGKVWAQSLGYHSLDTLTWRMILFFLFIHLLEIVFMLYEKFFLLQHSAWILALGNMISCYICYKLLHSTMPFFNLVFSCLALRFLYFILLSVFIVRLKNAPRGTI